MNEFISVITTGITAFIATNLDDLVILTLFFSQVNATFRPQHIVIGQYLGFCTLVMISLIGFLGGLVLPAHWIGLLGLVPITIGLNGLLSLNSDSSSPKELETESVDASTFAIFMSPQTYSVTAITIANGSDNVGIYMPLFANTVLSELLVIIGIFMLLVGIWCYIAYKLTCQSALANLLTHYGTNFVPFILMGLGVFIILDSASLTPFALTVICLVLMGLIKTIQSPKIKLEDL
ncbi:cadmium resistance transporter [Nostoc sp. UHCC 0702]|nr:cadmium resistance transporter [Nostoc sp. UHCC 0702]